MALGAMAKYEGLDVKIVPCGKEMMLYLRYFMCKKLVFIK
jgi:hypothetical protein